MTWTELEKIESFLKENGYRNGGKPIHCNADHYWYKPFGKEDNPYEEGRSLWQVFFNVYDWRQYWDRDPRLREFNKGASITATVHISRTIDEVGIELNFDLKDGKFDLRDGKFDLRDVEDKAYLFFKYIDANFAIPKEQ